METAITKNQQEINVPSFKDWVINILITIIPLVGFIFLIKMGRRLPDDDGHLLCTGNDFVVCHFCCHHGQWWIEWTWRSFFNGNGYVLDEQY
jgi:hypothetical protein